MDVPLDVFFGAADMPEATSHLTADLGASARPGPHPARSRADREARGIVIAGGTGVVARRKRAQGLAEAAHILYLSTGWPAACCSGHPSSFPVRAAPPWAKPTSSSYIGVPLDFRLTGAATGVPDDARLVFIDVDGHRKHRSPEVAIYGD